MSKDTINISVPDLSVMFCCFVVTVSHQNAGTEKSMFPLPEPQDVFLAAQVKFDDLNRDLRQLGRDLTSMWCQHCNAISIPAPPKNHPKKWIPILRDHSRFIILLGIVKHIPRNVSSDLSRQTSMWLGDRNSLALWSFCCVFLFENPGQPV